MQYFSWRKARWNNCTSSSSQTSHCLASPQQSLVTVQVQTDTLPSHQKVCINRDMWKMNFEVICFCIVSQVTWLRLPLLHLWRYRFQANQHEMTSSLSPPHPPPPQFGKICNFSLDNLLLSIQPHSYHSYCRIMNSHSCLDWLPEEK